MDAGLTNSGMTFYDYCNVVEIRIQEFWWQGSYWKTTGLWQCRAFIRPWRLAVYPAATIVTPGECSGMSCTQNFRFNNH
jgi:hypothetical protein